MQHNNGKYAFYENLRLLFEAGLDIENRTIYLTSDIEPTFVDAVVKALHVLDRKKGNINLWVSSDGGSVDCMFYLYDNLLRCKNKIITYGSGDICSAAVIILACGDRRYVTENAMLMHHEIHGNIAGSSRAVESAVESILRAEKKMWNVLARHTNKSAKEWLQSARKKGEIWLSAPEMVEWRIADEVLYPPEKRIKKGKKK